MNEQVLRRSAIFEGRSIDSAFHRNNTDLYKFASVAFKDYAEEVYLNALKNIEGE